jgi:polyhydroxyalkanoate synthase subunit PhaC
VVKWQVDNGIQTFVISWRNPTKEQGSGAWPITSRPAEKALEVVCSITGREEGQRLGLFGRADRIGAGQQAGCDRQPILGTLTLMVCVLHPKPTDIEAGSLVTENGMQLARQRAPKAGRHQGDDLARGFAWLRPNDLIWNYVINNYLLGHDPPAFDVLFWNADATNLSASLMGDFLHLFETLAFTKQGEVEMAGHKIDLSKVTADLFILGGVTDHITPWKATYRSTQLFGSKDVTYVLSQSGHMQAILNPPGNPKAKYFVSEKGGQAARHADDGCRDRGGPAAGGRCGWSGCNSVRARKSRPPERWAARQHPPTDPHPGLYVVEEV